MSDFQFIPPYYQDFGIYVTSFLYPPRIRLQP